MTPLEGVLRDMPRQIAGQLRGLIAAQIVAPAQASVVSCSLAACASSRG